MGALKQQHMVMQEQGISILDMSDDQFRERAINFLIRELSFSLDEIENTVEKVIKVKTGKRNDYTTYTEPAESESLDEGWNIKEWVEEGEA
jgi:hypothetical protein